MNKIIVAGMKIAVALAFAITALSILPADAADAVQVAAGKMIQ